VHSTRVRRIDDDIRAAQEFVESRVVGGEDLDLLARVPCPLDVSGEGIAVRRDDADAVGTEVGEHACCARGWIVAEVEDAQPFEEPLRRFGLTLRHAGDLLVN
jgi:hypothetical protein